MKIISSQRYLDYDIVAQKMAELESEAATEVIIEIIDAGMQDLDGNDLYIMDNGHHTKEAGECLGIEVKYEEIKNHYNTYGEDLLRAAWIDSDWYYVDNGYMVW